MKQNARYIWAALFCIYIATVAYLCFAKPDNLPTVQPDLWGIPIDKVAHFMMFFPYPIVAYGTFRPFKNGLSSCLIILAVIYVAGIGLATGTEYLQGLSEYRSRDIKDFYADTIGMSCSAVLTLAYILVTKNRRCHE